MGQKLLRESGIDERERKFHRFRSSHRTYAIKQPVGDKIGLRGCKHHLKEPILEAEGGYTKEHSHAYDSHQRTAQLVEMIPKGEIIICVACHSAVLLLIGWIVALLHLVGNLLDALFERADTLA